jgi:hypothetical protein
MYCRLHRNAIRILSSPIDQFVGGGKGGCCGLIHVVVAILRQPSDEGHSLFFRCKHLIALEQYLVFGSRYRVIRFAFSAGIFVRDGCAGVCLSGEMFEFGNAGVIVFVREIERADLLVLRD